MNSFSESKINLRLGNADWSRILKTVPDAIDLKIHSSGNTSHSFVLELDFIEQLNQRYDCFIKDFNDRYKIVYFRSEQDMLEFKLTWLF